MGAHVALAVVDNPQGVAVMGFVDGVFTDGISEGMIRDFIKKDLARYPELRAKAERIQEVVIATDERISPDNYAQDMMRCYMKHMASGGWAVPEGLHVFETFMASVRVYVAYGI